MNVDGLQNKQRDRGVGDRRDVLDERRRLQPLAPILANEMDVVQRVRELLRAERVVFFVAQELTDRRHEPDDLDRHLRPAVRRALVQLESGE